MEYEVKFRGIDELDLLYLKAVAEQLGIKIEVTPIN